MTRIIIVEDHLLFRKGLISILEDKLGVSVIAEFSDGKEFLEQVDSLDRSTCDLIFLDLAMPWKSGIDILQELQDRMIKLPPFCILSMYPDVFYLEQTKALGAKGYLSKDCDPDTLFQAIVEITQGGSFFLQKTTKKQQQNLLENLSKRELEVFSLLIRGSSMKEIAYDLHISIKSVSTYKSRLMEKLGADSLSDLLKMTVMFAELEHDKKR